MAFSLVQEQQPTAGSKLRAIPRAFVEDYGASAGYLLKCLAYNQRGANKKPHYVIAGTTYFRRPITKWCNRTDKNYRPIAGQLPWLESEQSIRNIVRKLRLSDGKPLQVVSYKRAAKGKAKENAYHVSKKVCKIVQDSYPKKNDAGEWTKSAKQPLVWFDEDDAIKFGINDAIVLNVIKRDFHLRKSEHLIVSRKAIARATGLPEQTVRDAYRRLQDAKIIAVVQDYQGKKMPMGAVSLLVANPCTMKALGQGHKYISEVVSVAVSRTSSNPVAKATLLPEDTITQRPRGENLFTDPDTGEIYRGRKDKERLRLSKLRERAVQWGGEDSAEVIREMLYNEARERKERRDRKRIEYAKAMALES